MIKKTYVLILFLALCVQVLVAQHTKNDLRAPAFPLITIDPNSSGWSYTNNLYDSSPVHWSDKKTPFLGVVKIDGELYRFMGTEELEMIFPSNDFPR